MGFRRSLAAEAPLCDGLCRDCAVSQEWEQMHLKRKGSGWPADGPQRPNKWLSVSTSGTHTSTQTNAFKRGKDSGWKILFCPRKSLFWNLQWPLLVLAETHWHQNAGGVCLCLSGRDPSWRIGFCHGDECEVVVFWVIKLQLRAQHCLYHPLIWILCS